ncbi:MAG TPA: hypothetical protein VF501_07715 [Thiobacillus sp.]
MSAAPRPRSSVSLQRHFVWLLLSVVGMFAVGIALSLWFSLQSNRVNQQTLLQIEAVQARANLVRRLDYYRTLLDNAARDPELIGLMRTGPVAAQQQWAVSRQRLLPDLLGLALVDPQGRVLGDAALRRAGRTCSVPAH